MFVQRFVVPVAVVPVAPVPNAVFVVVLAGVDRSLGSVAVARTQADRGKSRETELFAPKGVIGAARWVFSWYTAGEKTVANLRVFAGFSAVGHRLAARVLLFCTALQAPLGIKCIATLELQEAVERAAVAALGVAIVAFFDVGLQVAVAAGGEHAGAEAACAIAIIWAEVAFFDVLLDKTIAAGSEQTGGETGGIVGIVFAGIAFFDTFVDYTVAAGGEHAGDAAVGVIVVSVVAGLALIDQAVTAGIDPTIECAASSLIGIGIALITFFDALVEVAVAAGGEAAVGETGGIFAIVFAVIAGLGTWKCKAIAAGGEHALGCADTVFAVLFALIAFFSRVDTAVTAEFTAAVIAAERRMATAERGLAWRSDAALDTGGAACWADEGAGQQTQHSPG